jgi:hypothetical protein
MGFWLPSGRVYDFVPSVRLTKLKNPVFSLGHPSELPIIEKICFSPTVRPCGLSEIKNSIFSFYHPIGISEGKKHF